MSLASNRQQQACFSFILMLVLRAVAVNSPSSRSVAARNETISGFSLLLSTASPFVQVSFLPSRRYFYRFLLYWVLYGNFWLGMLTNILGCQRVKAPRSRSRSLVYEALGGVPLFIRVCSTVLFQHLVQYRMNV